MVFPTEFEKALAAALPSSEVLPLLASLQVPSKITVRLNPNKYASLQPELVSGKIEHCDSAFLLHQRPEFVSDPAFHAGYYYVQEASSSIVGTVLGQLLQNTLQTAVVLDLCAAPGGKSTHAASVLRANDILVANEVIHSRTPILQENLTKWGTANHIITRADAAQLGKCSELFDIIIADMPCSGEGLFRKDPASVLQWSEENVNLCSARQKRITTDIWPALKPGGMLLYSTCTFNTRENEEMVTHICNTLDAEIVELHFPESWNLFVMVPGCYRLLPHRSPGEGFFFSVIRKKGEPQLKIRGKIPSRKSDHAISKIPISLPDNYIFYTKHEDIFAINNENFEHVATVLNKLPCLYQPGTHVGRNIIKRNSAVFKPETGLALMADLPEDAYPRIQLDDIEILKYLRRDSLPNSGRLQGPHLITWNNYSIGFVNGTSFQWNNLWPMEWRIRKEGLTIRSILNVLVPKM